MIDIYYELGVKQSKAQLWRGSGEGGGGWGAVAMDPPVTDSGAHC